MANQEEDSGLKNKLIEIFGILIFLPLQDSVNS